jgi:ankyrin repeat protein
MESFLITVKNTKNFRAAIRYLLKYISMTPKCTASAEYFLTNIPHYVNHLKDGLFLNAVCFGCLDSIDWFLNHGANIDTTRNMKSSPKGTALQLAAGTILSFSRKKKWRKDIIIYLIKHGCTINQISCCQTALDCAVSEGTPEIIDLLRAHGAKTAHELELKAAIPADPDKDQNLITYAAVGNAEGIVQLLDTGANINAQDDGGNTALMLAARNGYKETVKMLLKYGASHAIRNRYGQTAVDLAKECGQRRIVQIIKRHL